MPISKFSKLLITISVGSVLYGWVQQQQPGHRSGAFIAFLDVGQGDAIYIRTTTGADVLIDGGPGRTVLERLPEVMAPGDTTIELVILSHPDADHSSGVVEVAKCYAIKQIATTALPPTKPLHQELWNLIASKHITHLLMYSGDHIALDDHEYFDILYPDPADPLVTLETNDTSMMVEYHYQYPDGHEKITLLTGDAGKVEEEALINRGLLHDIDICLESAL